MVVWVRCLVVGKLVQTVGTLMPLRVEFEGTRRQFRNINLNVLWCSYVSLLSLRLVMPLLVK